MFQREARQLRRFILVGVLVVGFDLIVYLTLYSLSENALISKPISFACGLLLSWQLNKAFVFRVASKDRARFTRFVSLNLLTLAANTGINFLALEALHDDSPVAIGLAFITATAFSAAVNYGGLRFFVFRTLS